LTLTPQARCRGLEVHLLRGGAPHRLLDIAGIVQLVEQRA
jgi:hypothetical protein